MSIDHVILPILGGMLTSSWGAYKDSPYENFSSNSFFRSIIVTLTYFLCIQYFLSDRASTPIIVVLASVAFERITQEVCKAFFRKKQKHNVYKIPQSFHVLGKVVPYTKRVIIGIALVIFLAISFFLLSRIMISGYNWIAFGLILSIVPSFGGAWKDAPIEGFEVSKFPRSFLIMFGSILVLRAFTNNFLLLIMSSAGLERLLVEFYKTFIVKSVPGKFYGKVIAPEWLNKRVYFKATFIFGLILLILLSR